LLLAGPAFAFLAGVLTILSPCGYPLLPGYFSRYLGSRPSIKMALFGSILCTLGLIIVFSVLGCLPSLFGSATYGYLPWMIPLSGVIVISMGVALILGFESPRFAFFLPAPHRQGLAGFVLYGIAYGLAALGCSAPIFLSVVVFALSSGRFLEGVEVFSFYALGMGSTLAALSAVFAKAGELVLRRFSHRLERMNLVSGTLLVAIGLYLMCYFYTVYW